MNHPLVIKVLRVINGSGIVPGPWRQAGDALVAGHVARGEAVRVAPRRRQRLEAAARWVAMEDEGAAVGHQHLLGVPEK